MAKRDTNTGIPDDEHSVSLPVTFRSYSPEKIEVELTTELSFIVYPYGTAKIDREYIYKIQDLINKGHISEEK